MDQGASEKVKRTGYLFEEVCSFDNLLKAAHKAMKGKRQRSTTAWFNLNKEFELLRIQEVLMSGDYEPGPYNCFNVYEPKERYICSVDFRDKVVHHALCRVLEPLFEKWFIFDSYACRKNKGTHRAIRRVKGWARKSRYFLKADVKKFFESIDHEVLKGLLSQKIKDQKLLTLMERIIDKPIPGYLPGKGLAIGNLTSQWWANFYLDPLDHYLKDKSGVKYYIRYMDDLVILGQDKAELHLIKASIGKFLAERLKLELKEQASFVAPLSEGIPFLGFRIFPGLIRLQHNTLVRFSRKYRQKESQYVRGEIEEQDFIRSATSLIGHIQHGNTYRLRQKFFYGGEG
jgi:RNA-directed DNA polymerase